MLCSNNPISQLNLDICPIWFQLMSKDLEKLIFVHSWFTRMFRLCSRCMVSPTDGADCVVTT
jgi:hypothetical protein